jgi:thiamine transport system substrate-binding protein
MTTGEFPARRVRRPGRLGRALIAVVLALVVVVAGFAVYEYYASGAAAGGPTLVVYTYGSLFNGNCGAGAANLTTVLQGFESAEGARVELECPSANLVSALEDPAAYGLPAADVVLGLDEITGPQADALGLLAPYAPPELAQVPPWLVSELAPDHAVVPYEYGYLSVDYTPQFNATTGGAIAHTTLPSLVDNASWAAQLVTENPLYDITGEEFLAWEVTYYEDVLHASWPTFWRTFFGESHPTPQLSWSDAFAQFGTPTGQNQLVVSYATDPAYAVANGAAGTLNATLSWWNGTAYGWRTIYGMGIVAGTRHLSLAEAFERYWLSGAVQAYLPTNEWEYPANDTVALPAVFANAVNPVGTIALNNETTPAAVAQNLTAPGGWLDTWASLAGGG